MEEKLVLKNKTNLLTIKIYRENGEYTGNDLVFNLKDIELIGRYDEMHNLLTKNTEWYNNQKIIINKQQDFQPKNSIMTNNQKRLYEITKEYLKKQTNAFEMFLGKGAIDKVLDGGSFDMDSIMIIRDYIEEQILPHLNVTKDNITKELKDKYNVEAKEEVLE